MRVREQRKCWIMGGFDKQELLAVRVRLTAGIRKIAAKHCSERFL
jgi:hypothetical protein